MISFVSGCPTAVSASDGLSMVAALLQAGAVVDDDDDDNDADVDDADS